MPNRTIGNAILYTALALFGAYTVWAVVLPFLPDDSPVHEWVPDRKWAIVLPSLVLVMGLSTVGVYIGLLMRQDALLELKEREHEVGKQQR
ncbi:hypothetical protein EX895_003924 [Sporisorium graminicola]|uniref:Dolichol phosphate-mannose biosynthesis regulatory protein n=1 Tax=Sporisorium graminicola TaxID=280036 RepID=A0A4U7KT73_9BASI|nr:hypothetical protein EX895_003924 [Sporisorium graminicola]TKY87247.1 hypothetical protein EX895_003924 [Sporisorium graminicola]